ncbi:hypothetical protein GR183_21140 [Stappia sp. GBMRC 2046]|uniref:Uncharacterized protein n=1 Tax=Stappia sediminis TaxID=2692190 RepID=A0A7X3LYG4_9HYPH|nr:hypothetical protein [Stappia sediminis]MXN67420.1 hypothetical protein [Stappia sediminis]
MKINDVIEIASNGQGAPTGLIRAIYQASQFGQIALVLHDIEPESVDQILDPVVETLPRTIPGVVYIDFNDKDRIREVVSSANCVFFATRAFRRIVSSCGVDSDRLYSVKSSALGVTPLVMNGHLPIF